jgi:AcrR family transcriptional regulator
MSGQCGVSSRAKDVQQHLLLYGRDRRIDRGSGSMPYPVGHRDEVRTSIVRGAQRLFNRHGFEAVSIDAIMASAGLSRGGFYRYFSSKSQLYAEAMDCFFTNPACGNRWDGVTVDVSRLSVAPALPGYRGFLPDGRASRRRGAERRLRQARLRECVQRHDRPSSDG